MPGAPSGLCGARWRAHRRQRSGHTRTRAHVSAREVHSLVQCHRLPPSRACRYYAKAGFVPVPLQTLVFPVSDLGARLLDPKAPPPAMPAPTPARGNGVGRVVSVSYTDDAHRGRLRQMSALHAAGCTAHNYNGAFVRDRGDPWCAVDEGDATLAYWASASASAGAGAGPLLVGAVRFPLRLLPGWRWVVISYTPAYTPQPRGVRTCGSTTHTHANTHARAHARTCTCVRPAIDKTVNPVRAARPAVRCGA